MQCFNIRLLGILALFFLASCATVSTPQQTGLDFWKKRTMLDPAAAQYVEGQYSELVKKDILANRVKMMQTHPDINTYRFDFSRIRVTTLRQDGQTARIRINGPVYLISRNGSLLEEDMFDDTFDLVNEFGLWKIDYDQKLKNGLKKHAG